MSDNTKAIIAITALNSMFEGSHFDICTIDNVAKMLAVHPERDAYQQLRALHCINWNKMPRELRAAVPGLVQQALAGGEHVPVFSLATESSQVLAVIDGSKHTRRPILQRILGN